MSTALFLTTYSPPLNIAGTSSLFPDPPVTLPPEEYPLIIPPFDLNNEPKKSPMPPPPPPPPNILLVLPKSFPKTKLVLNSSANCCILSLTFSAIFVKASLAVAVPLAKDKKALLNSLLIVRAVSAAPS